MNSVLLTQGDAAAFLRLSIRTLERHRANGTGPAYVLLGRSVRYRMQDLLDWIELHRRVPEGPAAKANERMPFGGEGQNPDRPALPEHPFKHLQAA
jgi:hypothetical protein